MSPESFRYAGSGTHRTARQLGGSGSGAVWLDIAREYTGRWHHQQQMRDAVSAPELSSRRIFAPVLSTFVFALPWTYRSVLAEEGATVTLQISGTAGGE